MKHASFGDMLSFLNGCGLVVDDILDSVCLAPISSNVVLGMSFFDIDAEELHMLSIGFVDLVQPPG